MRDPLIIAVTGGSGSGKTFFLQELMKHFQPEDICLINQDNYYRERNAQPVDEQGIINFDLPQSIDDKRLLEDIEMLKSGHAVEMLEYTFNNPQAHPRKLVFQPAPVIIIEGLMVLYWQHIRSVVNLTVFVDAEELTKVKRRIERDAKERGYDLDDVLYRYQYHVDPFYKRYLEPLKKEVDIIVPNNTGLVGGIKVLVGFIKHHLERG